LKCLSNIIAEREHDIAKENAVRAVDDRYCKAANVNKW
jgi:hypothetical protein